MEFTTWTTFSQNLNGNGTPTVSWQKTCVVHSRWSLGPWQLALEHSILYKVAKFWLKHTPLKCDTSRRMSTVTPPPEHCPDVENSNHEEWSFSNSHLAVSPINKIWRLDVQLVGCHLLTVKVNLAVDWCCVLFAVRTRLQTTNISWHEKVFDGNTRTKKIFLF